MKLFFYSLRSRIFLSTTFIVVVLTLVFGWLSTTQQTSSLEQELIKRGQMTARHLAYGAELGVLTRDVNGLNTLLKKIQNEKDVVYAEVFDEKGGLITAVNFNAPTDSSAVADPDGEFSDMPNHQKLQPWKKLKADGQEIYEFYAPVVSDIQTTDESMLLDEKSASVHQNIGSIHIALSAASIRAAIHQSIINGITTFAMLMLFALLVSWWLSRALTKPLENMGAVIRKTESGDLDQRLHLHGNNEITQLGMAFNRMLDALNERDRDLYAQQRIMQLILDTAPVGIWMLDANRRIKFINRAFADAVGVSEQSFLQATDYAELLQGQAGNRFMASDDRCFETGSLTVSQEQIPCADGKTHIFDVVKAPLRDEQGEIAGLVGIAIDATARIEADAEKEKMQQQVEHTQRLESLGVLAGGIAHDFNNLLTSIMGNAAMAERKVVYDPVAGKKCLTKIVQSSEKAALLCKQMLDYSGKGHFIIKPINLSAMVEGVTSLLGASIHSTIELNYHLAHQLPCIEADEAQLQQVVMNLVINASDAIGEKGGTITLSTGHLHADARLLAKSALPHDDKLDEGEYVVLEVSDTGCGMDKDTRQRLFEPFFTTKFTGRGLGMSAVQGIIRGHKGAVSVDSEPGRGTTFKILFPVSAKRVEESKPCNTEFVDWQAAGTVLIIDDEEIIREIAALMLEDFGFQTITAVDGLDGVDAYKRHQSDIVAVLMDMTMPRLDGEGCFRKLRQIDPNVQVILSSGYNEQDVTGRFSGEGLAGFVQKPYHPDALRDAMRQFMT